MTTPVTITSPQIVLTNTGQRGNSWLSGTGAPPNSLGIDGDFYLDTANVGVYYGPRTGGVWGGTHAFTAPLTNYGAASAPTAANDGTQGYTRGSTWINTATGIVYVCTSNATGAPVWLPTFPVGTGASTVAAGNDSRIVNALQNSNNLSDVTSAATSRTNLGLSAIVTAKSNLTATTAPTISNDLTQGYSVGSEWINTATNNVYVCTSNAAGAAVWVQTLPVGSTASGDLFGTYPSPTVAKINGTSVPSGPPANRVLTTSASNTATWALNPPGLTVSTGVVTGGIMTVNGSNPAAFDITQATGFICDYSTNPSNPSVVQVTVPAQTVVISGAAGNRTLNWWLADSTGTIFSQGTAPSDSQRRNFLQLGATGSTLASPGPITIFSIQTLPQLLIQPTSQLYDLMYGIGPFSVNNGGNLISPNGANLQVNKTSGQVFSTSFGANVPANKSPHLVNSPAETPLQWKYVTQTPGSEGTNTTTITPGLFDNNGVVTAVGGGTGTSTIQYIWLFGTGVSGVQTLISYGQTTFASLSAAQAAVGSSNLIVNPDIINAGGVLIGWIAMTKGATALNNIAQASFVQAGRFPTP